MSAEPDMTFILTTVADSLSRHVFACVCLHVENLSHQLNRKAETGVGFGRMIMLVCTLFSQASCTEM